MAEHIALLGDSIFDNGSYTGGLPDVVTHLRGLLPAGGTASLLAIDGTTTAELSEQTFRIPEGVTRAVVSIGGNDALINADLLNLPVSSTRDALLLFDERAGEFEANYREAIGAVVEQVPSTTVCTIYNGDLSEDQAATARVALMLFNDVILRVAFDFRLPVIDLRLICSERSDYANAIEPSSSGGAKIARAIAATLGADGAASRVFTGQWKREP